MASVEAMRTPPPQNHKWGMRTIKLVSPVDVSIMSEARAEPAYTTIVREQPPDRRGHTGHPAWWKTASVTGLLSLGRDTLLAQPVQ